MQPADEGLRETPVWSGLLRLSHWVSAAAVLVLLGSGWLLALRSPGSGMDLHAGAGYVLVLALGLRGFLLLFGRGAEHWRDLVPGRGQWSAAGATLRFYATLGRAPLPGWYAHNPLWSPLYLVLWLLLLAGCLTGWVALHPGRLTALIPWQAHGAIATAVAVWCVLHVAAVVLHDLRGGTADASAMINGRRLFRLRKSAAPGAVELPVSDLLRERHRRR